MAVIATPGAADANSYITLVEFAAYLTTRLHVPAAVTGATDPTREAAVIMATRYIDGMCFLGAATTDTQALQWPRTGMESKSGGEVDDSIIPQEIKNATAELAMLLIVTDLFAPYDVSVQGITKIKAGPVELGFKSDIPFKGIPDSVLSLIPYGWRCESAADAEIEGGAFMFEAL